MSARPLQLALTCALFCACSDEAATPLPVGPTGTMTLAITEPDPADAPVCASLGQGADAHFPLLVDVDEVLLEPPGQCQYAQCGHLALYADGVLNNESAVPAIDLLARKLADPYHDGSEHGDGSGPDVLALTLEVIGPRGDPLCGDADGNLEECSEDFPPIQASIDLITFPNCCGNGTVDLGEECDDGGTVNDDGCSDRCVVECKAPDHKAPDNHCYHLGATALSWQAARTVCQALGPTWDLVGLSTVAERDWLDANVSVEENVWTSGSDASEEGTFEWLNGEVWGAESDTLWWPEQPNGGEDQNCVRLTGGGDTETLYDSGCAELYLALCELIPAGS